MGILDQTGLLDPQMAGLLQAAFTGMQASGPSAMPVSLGQVFGKAGSAGLGAFGGALTENRKMAQAQALIDLEKQKAQMLGVQGQMMQQKALQEAEATRLAQERQQAVQGILGRIGQPVSLAPTNENAAAPKLFTEQDALSAMRRAGLLPEAEQLVKAMPKLDTVNLGGKTGVVDLRATPAGTVLDHTVSPDTNARLEWDKYQFGNLSKNQREQLSREDARIGLDRTRTMFDTGMGGMGGVGGVAVGGAPVVGAPRPMVGAQPAIPAMTPKQLTEINAAVAKDTALKQAEAARNLPQAVAQADQTVGLIDQMIGTKGLMVGKGKEKAPHPGFSDYVGATLLPGASMVDGTDAAGFKALLDQVKGQTFLQAYETLRGGGQITEAEGKKATQALTRMDKAQSESEFIKAAREFQGILRGGVERARKKAGAQAAVVAPTVDDLVNKYAPQ